MFYLGVPEVAEEIKRESQLVSAQPLHTPIELLNACSLVVPFSQTPVAQRYKLGNFFHLEEQFCLTHKNKKEKHVYERYFLKVGFPPQKNTTRRPLYTPTSSIFQKVPHVS